jgi:ABC-type lipoprotein export system ATPase subunit
MPGATVEVKDVSRIFRVGGEDVHAVTGVSLNIAPGEFVALTGRSGSGKTTLINIIAGLDTPTTGEVLIDGVRVDKMSSKELNELRRHKLGFIFQSFGLLPLLSAQENIELPLRIAGFGHGERTKRAKRVLDMVGLGKRADHRPYELSGGEQQRVAIARALATQPVLMLADEPTGELDSATATIVFGILRDIARHEGITIITCTHDRLVMELADRVEELANGHIVTGQEHTVWEKVQERTLSPFSAQRLHAAGIEAEGMEAVSSLIGADRSLFKFEAEETPAATPDEGRESATEPEPASPAEDAGSRWSRPHK